MPPNSAESCNGAQIYILFYSELPERLKGASWKDDGRENGTRVQLPHSLPCINIYMNKYTLTVGTDKGDISITIPETIMKDLRYVQARQISKDTTFSTNEEFIDAMKKDFDRLTEEIQLGLWNFDRPISALNIGSGTGLMDLIISKYLNNGSKFWLLDKAEVITLEGGPAQWGNTDHGFYNSWIPFYYVAKASGIDIKNFKMLQPGDAFPEKLDVIKSNRSYMYHYPKDVYWHQIAPHAHNGARLWFDFIYRKDRNYIDEISTELNKKPVASLPIGWVEDHIFASEMLNINGIRGAMCMWL